MRAACCCGTSSGSALANSCRVCYNLSGTDAATAGRTGRRRRRAKRGRLSAVGRTTAIQAASKRAQNPKRRKMDTYEQLQKLILQNGLGTKIVSVQTVAGGLTHKMYRVQTDRAVYAIKVLDPAIMRKKEALGNFDFSERVARTAAQNGIHAVCALQLGGKVVQNVDGAFLMVFEWLDGTSLRPKQVTLRHCNVIGQTLANLHNTDFGALGDTPPQSTATQPHFDRYIAQAHQQNKPFAQHLQRDATMLSEWGVRATEAMDCLGGETVISHTDLDCKNVMWQGLTPFVIDWEASGRINPAAELVQVAWYWAGGDVENLRQNKFEAVLNGYVGTYRGRLHGCCDLVCANLYPKLAWLQYNLKRACEGTGPTELADSEVTKSLQEIEYCVNQIDAVMHMLQAVLWL